MKLMTFKRDDGGEVAIVLRHVAEIIYTEEGDLAKIEIFYTNNQMSTIELKKKYGREVYKEMLTKLKEEW